MSNNRQPYLYELTKSAHTERGSEYVRMKTSKMNCDDVYYSSIIEIHNEKSHNHERRAANGYATSDESGLGSVEEYDLY